MKEYLPRLVDDVLERKLKLYGAVCIEGCKWCGKSTTAKQHSKSYLELQNPATFENNMEIAALVAIFLPILCAVAIKRDKKNHKK